MTTISRLNGQMRRIHKKFTKEVTVDNYTWDDSAGSNEYADGDWTKTSTTAQVSIRLPDDVDYSDDAAGETTNQDVFLWISPEDVDVRVDAGDETRATEFYDSDLGQRYKAIGVHDESSLYRVECREV